MYVRSTDILYPGNHYIIFYKPRKVVNQICDKNFAEGISYAHLIYVNLIGRKGKKFTNQTR